MAAVAHNAAFAKRVGISQKVGKEFNSADKGTGILKKKKRAKDFFNHPHSQKEMT